MNNFLNTMEKMLTLGLNYMLEGYPRDSGEYLHHAEVCQANNEICGYAKAYDPGDALHFALIDLESKG